MERTATPPETRYAKSGDVHIAYQVVGDGPFDLVHIPGFVSHLECAWEWPSLARFYERLASFSRLILFDKRGTGLSDRVQIATLEQRMDDVRAVMDAVGSDRAALFGVSEGGPMSALFAATYPERTTTIVTFGTAAARSWAPDDPGAPMPAQFHAFFEAVERDWGRPDAAIIGIWSPSVAHDEEFRQWSARHSRLGASPGAAAALLRIYAEIDVRDILPTIHVPALILHRTGDRACNVNQGRDLASHIPGAKYVELPGDDHLWYVGDTDKLLGEVEEFLTGVRRTPDTDRVLATIMFTDIVGSTERAAAVGDRRWHDLLESHNALLRRELARFRGREVKSTGDGVLATFDGPARAIRSAQAIRDGVRKLGIEIRAGLHTGECEMMGEDVGGIAVHIGARVASLAGPGEVLVSSTVKDLVAGSGIQFADRGAHVLRGVPDEWRLFAVQ